MPRNKDEREGVGGLITFSSYKGGICLNNACPTLIKHAEYVGAPL